MIINSVKIIDFANAWFNDDFSKLSKEDFNSAYEEYIDVASLYNKEEFDKRRYIHNLSNRYNYIRMLIEANILLLNEFDAPNIESFASLRKYGYYISWDGDRDKFIEKCNEILSFEENNKIKIDISKLELDDILKKGEQKTSSKKDARISFFKMINSLRKLGNFIDIQNNTVEELCIVILQQQELKL